MKYRRKNNEKKFIYAIVLLCIIILAYKGYEEIQKNKSLDRVETADNYEDLLVKDSVNRQEKDEKGIDENSESSIFPIIIKSPRINIEIYDYYFKDSIPQNVCNGELENVLKKNGCDRLFNEEGEFNNNALFMIMDYKVTNNLDESWTYCANSASIMFADEEDAPKGVMNEMVYFSESQKEGHESMLYDFEPKGEYTATSVFVIYDKNSFFNGEKKGYLVFNTSGCNILTEEDRILLLDQTRINN